MSDLDLTLPADTAWIRRWCQRAGIEIAHDYRGLFDLRIDPDLKPEWKLRVWRIHQGIRSVTLVFHREFNAIGFFELGEVANRGELLSLFQRLQAGRLWPPPIDTREVEA